MKITQVELILTHSPRKNSLSQIISNPNLRMYSISNARKLFLREIAFPKTDEETVKRKRW